MICIFRKRGFRFWFPLSVLRDIPDIRSAKVRCAYNTELPFQTIVYYNIIQLNTPETAGVSHPVYWLFLYGLFMSHAHNPPPRASNSRPPFQSPGSVRMFCIARRSVVGFSYQWRWTSVISVVCKKIDCVNRVAKSSSKYIEMWLQCDKMVTYEVSKLSKWLRTVGSSPELISITRCKERGVFHNSASINFPFSPSSLFRR